MTPESAPSELEILDWLVACLIAAACTGDTAFGIPTGAVDVGAPEGAFDDVSVTKNQNVYRKLQFFLSKGIKTVQLHS